MAKRAKKAQGASNPYYSRVIKILKKVVESHSEQLASIHRAKPDKRIKQALVGLAEAQVVIAGICMRAGAARKPTVPGPRKGRK